MARLTRGEAKVMRVLWEHGAMKPADIQARHPEAIGNSALRSHLATLLEKGHVARRLVGKAYFYSPTIRKRSAFRAMLGELADAYCGGSMENLVMNIIRSEKLSEADLVALRRLADEADDGPSAGDERRRER